MDYCNVSPALLEVTCHDATRNQSKQHPALVCDHINIRDLKDVDIKKTPVLIEELGINTAPKVFTRYTDTPDFLLLSFCSKTAAKTPVAHIALMLITKTINMSRSTHDNIVTALHEAILNALIHGNCELKSTYTDRESFLDFQKSLEDRLSDPLFSHKCITVEIGISLDTITLCVTDEGKGNSATTYNFQTKEQPHGRGLEIIAHYCKTVSFSPTGNTIIMTIDHDSFPLIPANEISNDNLERQRRELQEALKSSSILLVDDLDFNLLVLSQILESHGFSNFHTAKNGAEALEKMDKVKPDLVVLDLLMPEMDGFEFCKHIRNTPELKDLPIVVQTALTIPEQRLSAFEAGATDFIGKPVDPDEMIARLLVHLERQKLFNDLAQSRQRMAKELNDAREMQKMIMPSPQHIREIESSYNMRINSYFQPSSELGGDFWGIKPISKNNFGIYIVDFSGHGVTAALNTFRLHALMNEHINKTTDPGLFLTELNYSLTKLLSPGQFATMFYGVIDIEKNKLSYSAAASPNPILISSNTKEMRVIDGTGFPLGITNLGNYETKTINFYPGDAICLYSDALIETKDGNDAFLKEEDLFSLISEHVGDLLTSSSDTLMTPLLDRFSSHIPQLKDDLTINFYYRKSA